MKVSEYIAVRLKNYGLNHCFGFQGGAISPIIDALVNAGIEYIQNYHEQASGFCAGAYARITNKPGLAVVTNGPGLTNIISAIASSYLDSSPVLFISGQVKTTDMNVSKAKRQNGFQEINSMALVQSITKYAVTVKDAKNIKYELEKALHTAMTGRKGAVLLDLPLDIQQTEVDEAELMGFVLKEEEGKHPVSEKAMKTQIWEIINRIRKSERPLIIAGGGIQSSGTYDLYRQFTALTCIPSASTLMGLDAVSDLCCGFSGLYGNTHTNLAVYNADLLIVLGSRLAKRQLGMRGYNRSGNIVQIDIDESELGASIETGIKVHADLRIFLSEIIKHLEKHPLAINSFAAWHRQINEWKNKYYDNCCVNPVSLEPVEIIRTISRIIDKNAVICADVGQNQMWVAQGFEVKEGQRVLNSGGLGCMGFSLPASIGAQIAGKDKTVIAFMGDGGFQMNQQELQLIAQRKLPVKIIVFNNNSLGMIQEGQILNFNSRFFGTREGYNAPNFNKLAAAYDIEYADIEQMSDIEKLTSMMNKKTPCLIEVVMRHNPTLLLNQYNQKEVYETNLL